MTSSRYVHVLYCDDIRQEVNGKMTLVGCYGSELLVGQPAGHPIVLPKLCALVDVVTGVGNPFKKLVVRAFSSDDLLGEMEVPVDASMPPTSGDDDSMLLILRAVMTFVPFVVGDQPGKLRIEVETEAEKLRAPGLRLRFHETPAPDFDAVAPA